ncbi:hypothetical protein [Cellulosimicrobium funkei]
MTDDFRRRTARSGALVPSDDRPPDGPHGAGRSLWQQEHDA